MSLVPPIPPATSSSTESRPSPPPRSPDYCLVHREAPGLRLASPQAAFQTRPATHNPQPPQPTTSTARLHLRRKEKSALLESLSRRANRLAKALNEMEGVTCNDPEGAMYLFPRIELPDAVREMAEKDGHSAEFFYCIELLEQVNVHRDLAPLAP